MISDLGECGAVLFMFLSFGAVEIPVIAITVFLLLGE